MTWELFHGDGIPRRKDPSIEAWEQLPPLRSWRKRTPGKPPNFVMPPGLTDAVNASLHLRRPLLVSGGSGSGKSTLVDLIAAELELGTTLRWHITSKTALNDGLFSYDALSRLHATQTANNANPMETNVENFVTLGPLGTALAAPKARAVLIDEIDKSDLDLPSDLLNVMENGEFTIPVLARAMSSHPFTVKGADGGTYEVDQDGTVRRKHFPVVVFTSNGERAFPPPFLRRCIRFSMPSASREQLIEIVSKHLDEERADAELAKINSFADRLTNDSPLAINQIIEFVHLVTGEYPPNSESRDHLEAILLQELRGT